MTISPAANTGFASGGGDVQTWSFVLEINICDKLKFCASKPARTQSPKTLPAMLDDHTITTICKVLGGLSTTRLRADLDATCMFGALFNFLQVDSQPLTFIEKIISDRQSPNTTDNVLKKFNK